MMGLIHNLEIIDRELAYHERVYKGKTTRYQELIRKREVILDMLYIISLNVKK